jgi:hypothetical protein
MAEHNMRNILLASACVLAFASPAFANSGELPPKKSNLFRRLAFITIACFYFGPALAGANLETRIADSARVGAKGVVPDCSGKLLESYLEEGNASGYMFNFTLVCSWTPITAAWVVISDVDCYQQESKECNKALVPPDQENKDTQPPYRVKYILTQYGLGRNCRAVSKGWHGWSCKQLDFFDGTLKAGGDTSKFRTVTVETVADQPLKSE